MLWHRCISSLIHTSVLQQMASKSILSWRPIGAMWTCIRLLTSVCPHVHGEVSPLISTVWTVGALEWFFSCMSPHMIDEVSSEISGVSTVTALVYFNWRRYVLSKGCRSSATRRSRSPCLQHTVSAGGRELLPIMVTSVSCSSSFLQHEGGGVIRERVHHADYCCGSSLVSVSAQPHL